MNDDNVYITKIAEHREALCMLIRHEIDLGYNKTLLQSALCKLQNNDSYVDTYEANAIIDTLLYWLMMKYPHIYPIEFVKGK